MIPPPRNYAGISLAAPGEVLGSQSGEFTASDRLRVSLVKAMLSSLLDNMAAPPADGPDSAPAEMPPSPGGAAASPGDSLLQGHVDLAV